METEKSSWADETSSDNSNALGTLQASGGHGGVPLSSQAWKSPTVTKVGCQVASMAGAYSADPALHAGGPLTACAPINLASSRLTQLGCTLTHSATSEISHFAIGTPSVRLR